MNLAVESALKRDRLVVAASLALVTAIAWFVTARLALDMRWMVLGPSGWTVGYFAAMLTMWVVMMIGMMLPSAASSVLLFAALAKSSRLWGTGLFAAGYLACWAAFSVLATGAQWALAEADLLASPMAIRVGSLVASALFLVAAAYQLTPWKTVCLAKCRAPAKFLVEHWLPGRFGAFVMGVYHGAYCVGCCWTLMALLFAVGAMNLLWVTSIAALVLAEKLLPRGEWIARAAAAAMVVAAVMVL
jgi:predicted metal-binding membrane protein